VIWSLHHAHATNCLCFSIKFKEINIPLHQWHLCSFWHFMFICNCRKNPLFGIWMNKSRNYNFRYRYHVMSEHLLSPMDARLKVFYCTFLRGEREDRLRQKDWSLTHNATFTFLLCCLEKCGFRVETYGQTWPSIICLWTFCKEYSHPRAKVKNEWSHATTPHICLHGMYKDRLPLPAEYIIINSVGTESWKSFHMIPKTVWVLIMVLVTLNFTVSLVSKGRQLLRWCLSKTLII